MHDLYKKICLLLDMSKLERQEMKSRIKETVRIIESEDRIGMLISYYGTTIADYKKRQNSS